MRMERKAREERLIGAGGVGVGVYVSSVESRENHLVIGSREVFVQGDCTTDTILLEG